MNPTTAPTGRIPLYHQNHARRQRGKSVTHLMPALLLVLSALDALTGREPLSWITAAEFVVGAAYVALLVREWRQLRHNPHHQERVAWLEIAAAGILALEGYHLWHRHHVADAASGGHKMHVLPYLYWLLAGVFLVLAFKLRQLNERRHLHLHDEGFSGRLTIRGAGFHFRWPDVAAVEPIGPADLLVHHSDGRQQRLSLAQLHDGPALRDQLVAHAAARQGEELKSRK